MPRPRRHGAPGHVALPRPPCHRPRLECRRVCGAADVVAGAPTGVVMPPSTAVVAGALASKPFKGGETWVRLSWALGLRRLGFDVLFVEQLACAPAPEACAYFEQVTAACELPAALLGGDGSVAGIGAEELTDRIEGAELLVNLSGNLRSGALALRCRRRVYVDLDPAYTQIWHADGHDVGLAGHHLHLTVG